MERRKIARTALLLELRDMIPSVSCIPGCHDCCGPVGACTEEMQRLSDNGQVLLRSWGTAKCGYLKDGKCSIYEERPLVCRLFGATFGRPELKCPHGVVADYPLSGVLLAYLKNQYRVLIRDRAVMTGLSKTS